MNHWGVYLENNEPMLNLLILILNFNGIKKAKQY